MASVANLENKQTSNKAYRETKYYSQKIESISMNFYPKTVSAILLLGFSSRTDQRFWQLFWGTTELLKNSRKVTSRKKILKTFSV